MTEEKQVQKTEEKKEEKEVKKVNKKALVIGGVVLVGILGLFIAHSLKFQSTDDAYVEAHMIQIAPKVSGQITEVYIKDNQRVKEGDIVAKIDHIDYEVKFAQADAQYQKALLAQKVAQANFGAVNSEIEFAKKDLERYEKLYAEGAVSEQELDRQRTRYEAVKAQYSNADEQLLSKSNNKVADADLKTLKALREQAELHLSYTTIKAPRTGVVTNKKVEKGAYVQVGQPLFTIVADDVWIVANFKENQVGEMKPGQPVDIKIDAYPNKVFKGKVDSIQSASGAKSSLFPPENAVGSFVKIVQRIPVKIVFDEKIDKEKYNIVSGMSTVPKVRIRK
ncbi:HlyD family secretion protein [bacterium]|nr:HlyD family secretion protein [bacterium]